MNQDSQPKVYEVAKTTGEAYARLIPDQALSVGDPRYVPLDRVRGGINIAESLHKRVKSQEAELVREGDGSARDSLNFARLLLTGHSGCGKTTELFRLRELLENDGFSVVYYDAQEEFDLNNDIGWWNVILEMIWQLDEQLSSGANAIKIPEGPKNDAATWIARTIITNKKQTDVSAELSTEFGVEAGLPFFVKAKMLLKSLVKTGSTYLKTVETEAERRPGVLLGALSKIVSSINDQLKAKGRMGLVIIVDSLEKIPYRTDAGGITSHAAIFIHGGDKLKSPPCHLLYTLPLTLLNHNPVGQIFPDKPIVMPVVHVINREGNPDEVGISIMTDLLDKRVDSALLEQGVARQLALASGGQVRDFVRLAREAAGRFGKTITLADANAAIQDFINYYDDLYAARYHDALVSVHQEHLLPRGDFDSELIDKLLVLPYKNGESWYALHPCVLNGPRLRELR